MTMIKTTSLLLFAKLNLTLAELSFSFSNLWKNDYIHNPQNYLASFWVPAVVAVLFVFFALAAVFKRRIFLFILFLAISASCVFLISTGEQSVVLNMLEDLANH